MSATIAIPDDTVSLWVVYHDYAGLPRGKAVPADRVSEVATSGVSFAKANWDFAITDHQIPEPGFGADSGDFQVIPDPNTVVSLPHRPGVSLALGWLHAEGREWLGDPRRQLREQAQRIGDLGYSVRVGFEVEFSLLARAADGWQPLETYPMFTITPLELSWAYQRDVLQTLAGMGLEVHQLAREYGPGQFEISFLPRDPVAATDQFALARQVIKVLAHDHGLLASFMPKVRASAPGNGLHIHIGLESDGGSNAVAANGSLSDVGRFAVAGLLAHAPGQTALGSATPNSYKRLLPGSWAPAHVCWGIGNRAVLVRIPQADAGAHFEYRSADATCNPYLHLAGLLASIADGIEQRQGPPPAVDEDVGRWSDADAATRDIQRLPTSLPLALQALEDDRVLMDALGPIISQHYPRVKRFEHQSFIDAGGDPDDTTVTEWEREVYLVPV